MDVKKAIEVRRSIRRFKEKEVPDRVISEVIDAARRAPSGRNLQPWRFLVVKSKRNLLKFKKYGVFFQEEMHQAPVVIVCCVKKNPYSIHSIRRLEREMPHINLSIASAFLVLRATELGLGTCFVAWADKEKIRKILSIPKDFMIPYVIVMGYPNENPDPRGRKELKEIMDFENWQQH
jgi:nitroreductase